MIKFFRKIRQKMLYENKFSKYLIYAIGEIVLVVIGILIALQINNRNLQKQEDKIEQMYLLALHAEFENNEFILDSTILLNREIIKETEKLLSFFDVRVFDTISNKTISESMAQAIWQEIYYSPSTGVLTEIISSGNLILIENQELKQKLASFGNTLEFLKHQENEVLIHRHILEDMHVSSGNIGKTFSDLGLSFDWKSKFEKTSNLDLFNSFKYENRLVLFRGSSRSTDFHFYKPLKEDIKSIIKIIENELKN